MTSRFARVVTHFQNWSYRYDFPRRTRYVIVVGAAALAVLFTGSRAPSLIMRGAPSIQFLVIVLSSWYGGLGPGLMSVIVVVATSGLLTPASAMTEHDNWTRLILLSALAIVLSSIRMLRRHAQPAALLSTLARSPIGRAAGEDLSAQILESFRDTAIAAVDSQGRFVYANQAAASLLSRPVPEILGKSVPEVFPDDDGLQLFTQFRRVVAEGRPQHFEHQAERGQRYYAFHCYPGGEGFVFNFSDITENKKQEALRPLPLWNEDCEFKRIFGKIDYTLVDQARCYVLHQFAKQASELPGDLAEVGVYKGGTAKLLALTVAPRAQKTVHLFDTFAGMPPADAAVDFHHQGDLGDTSLEAVQRHLRDCGNVRFYQGFFPSTAGPIASLRFCLVHVDADIYNSVKAGCVFFYPRLEKGGILIFDDYGFPSCPGARKAVDEFFADKPECPIYLPSGQCVVFRT